MTVKRAAFAAVAAAVCTAVIAALVCLVVVFGGDGADMSYRSLDYEVQVLDDGDLAITQHIDVRLDDRGDDDAERPWKQLYQQYRLNPDNLTAISGVGVVNATTGRTYAQTDPRTPDGIGDDEWDADYANRWYIADVTDGDPKPYEPGTTPADATVEIGWNIPATIEADSIRFDVTMTFEGVSTAYDDVVSLQWEPFGAANRMPIGVVTGTVRFPDGVSADDSWAWLHYAGASETSRDGAELRFTAYDVRAGQHLDVVAMFDASAAGDVARVADGDAADRIIADETAQEAAWRDRQHDAAVRRVVVWALLALAGVALIVWGLVAAARSNREARYRGEITYWRDPPEMSPASAARLLEVIEPGAGTALGARQLSATVLSLASKKAIMLRPGPSSLYAAAPGGDAPDAMAARLSGDPALRKRMGETMSVTILPVCAADRASLNLSQSEDAALALLETAARRHGAATFDFDDMKRAFTGYTDGHTLQEAFETASSNEFALLGATRAVGGQALAAGLLGLLVGLAALVYSGSQGQLAVALVLGCPILFGSLTVLFAMRRTGLTEDPGQRYAGQVVGLKRYLEDFSDFTERGVADLTLWDRYLVYATAFGISDKAVAQLAKAHPELTDPAWLDSYASGTLLYWAYRPYWWYAGAWPQHGSAPAGPLADPSAFSAGFGDIGARLDAGFADIASTIQAAAPHGSGGSGGSFSGGGFGGSAGGSGGGSFGGR